VQTPAINFEEKSCLQTCVPFEKCSGYLKTLDWRWLQSRWNDTLYQTTLLQRYALYHV